MKNLITGLVLSCAANANPWAFMTNSSWGSSYFIDTTSIQKTNNHLVRFIERTDDPRDKTFSYSLTEIDCLDKTIRTLVKVTSYNNGQTIAFYDSLGFIHFFPDTIADIERKFICTQVNE